MESERAREVAERLLGVEDRLERLLASGWRAASAEAADLALEADDLEALGLSAFAARLRALAAAADARQALGGVALTTAASRRLRARLPLDDLPPGEWTPMAAPGRKAAPTEHLLPIGRLSVEGGETWACARLRGKQAEEWLLLEPLPRAGLPAPPPAPSGGLLSRLTRRAAPAETSEASEPPIPWLRAVVHGYRRWLAREPLGASGEVQRCLLAEPRWQLPAADGDPCVDVRKALGSGNLEDGLPVAGRYSPLQLKRLASADADGYLWPDPSAAEVFHSLARDQTWAVCWVRDSGISPLLLVEPGGVFRRARVIHLVPGAPSEPLAE
jgi:hypothetical protein